MRNKFFLILLTSIFILSMVGAQVTPHETTRTGEIDIQYSAFDTLKQGQNHTFNFYVANNTQFLDNSTVDCQLSLFNQAGNKLVDKIDLTDFETPNEFTITVTGGNFTQVGEYNAITNCNTSVQTGAVDFSFFVNSAGKTAGDFFSVLIWIIFIIAVIGNWTYFILILVKLVTATETVFGVITTWGLYILLMISSYISGFLLVDYVTQLSNNFLDLLRYTNVILPLISLIITMIWKGVKQKNPIGIKDFTGRRPF